MRGAKSAASCAVSFSATLNPYATPTRSVAARSNHAQRAWPTHFQAMRGRDVLDAPPHCSTAKGKGEAYSTLAFYKRIAMRSERTGGVTCFSARKVALPLLRRLVIVRGADVASLVGAATLHGGYAVGPWCRLFCWPRLFRVPLLPVGIVNLLCRVLAIAGDGDEPGRCVHGEGGKCDNDAQ